MYQVDHSDIILEYEILVVVDSTTNDPPKVDENFNIITPKKTKGINIAYFNVSQEDINMNNGFKSGDLKYIAV